MFYDTFAFLCKQRNISPSRAATEADISKSLVTKWKNSGTEVPSPEVLKKLSRYFNVTPDYLLGFDLQSKIDTLTYQISQLKAELRSSSADRIDEIESSIAILEESREDLIFAQTMGSSARNTYKEISPDEVQLTEGEKAMLELFRQVPEGQQQLVLQMIRAALNTSK